VGITGRRELLSDYGLECDSVLALEPPVIAVEPRGWSRTSLGVELVEVAEEGGLGSDIRAG
jgi:hypothetical protein